MIPFSILPPRTLQSAAERIRGTSGFAAAIMPSLKENLMQAGYDFAPREYAGMALVAALTNAFFSFVLVAALGLGLRINMLPAAAGVAILFAAATFFTILIYPRVVAKRRARKLEHNIIPALQQMLIQLKSGVPLFNAMASLSYDYDEVSEEFRKLTKKINSGTSELDALSEATLSNPSPQFRKVLWQISNALKVGSNLASVLDIQIRDLTRERIDQIRQYGQELSPWTMLYMMAAVIVPSLGVAMLTVLVGFLNTTVPKTALLAVLAGLLGFQVFFMNFVSTRRPAV